MKKMVFAIAALSLSAFSASAADMAVKAQPIMVAPAPVYSWSGFYLGVVGTGGVMGSEHADQWCDVTCSTPVQRAWGGGVGGTAGYNWQSGHVLYGIEGDYSWVNFKTDHVVPGYYPCTECGYNSGSTTGAKWDWYATLRGRMGLVVDDTMAYVTGGVAWAGTKYHSYYTNQSGQFDGGFGDVNSTRFGFAAGAGVEHKFTPNWSLKAEYLYVGLEQAKSTPYVNCLGCTTNNIQDFMTHRSDAHFARIGLNYALYGVGPISARY